MRITLELARKPRGVAIVSVLGIIALGCACGSDSDESPSTAPATRETPSTNETSTEAPETAPASAVTPDDLPNGLLLGYSQFAVVNGTLADTPGPARVEVVTRRGGQWRVEAFEDEASDVIHKAFVYEMPGQDPAVVTLGANAARVLAWRRADGSWTSSPLWTTEFGGERNRMRDAEVADLYGDGRPAIVVATHDQGVVAALRPQPDGSMQVEELDRRAGIWVHEIEIGDLDNDGTREVYATPSEPNQLGATSQHGEVVRYVPANDEGRTVVADLGDRHAKEILVADVDGDGHDELYVAVEALMEGEEPNLRVAEPVEIRRYEADTPPGEGAVIATIDDRLCRFLTVGDLDGDGDRELVAAAFSSGVWLMRPGRDPNAEWSTERVDRDSRGFEHAALITDLDGDGTDELYVAADEQGELRRYVWVNGRPRREVIASRDVPRSRMTWNIMPIPASFVQ